MAKKYDIIYVNFYTDGSAARNMAPAFPQTQSQRKAQTRKQKKTIIYFDPVAICSLMVAVMLLVMMAVGLTQFQQAQTEAIAMEQYLAELTLQNEQLSQKYQDELDLEAVEQTALALGMVPVEQVKTISITLHDAPVQNEPVSLVDQVLAFLTNLFA